MVMRDFFKKLKTEMVYAATLAQIQNPLGVSTFEDLIANVTKWLTRIATPIGVIVIVYAGAKFLMARGDTSKIQEAKHILWYTIIGLAIVFAASGLVSLVRSIISAA